VQFATKSKMFWGGAARRHSARPPQHAGPRMSGPAGALPAQRCRDRLAVRGASPRRCTVLSEEIFARKNYFYPDLPRL